MTIRAAGASIMLSFVIRSPIDASSGGIVRGAAARRHLPPPEAIRQCVPPSAPAFAPDRAMKTTLAAISMCDLVPEVPVVRCAPRAHVPALPLALKFLRDPGVVFALTEHENPARDARCPRVQPRHPGESSPSRPEPATRLITVTARPTRASRDGANHCQGEEDGIRERL